MKLKKLLKNIRKYEIIRIFDNDKVVNTTKDECLKYFRYLHKRQIKEIVAGKFMGDACICIYLEN